MKLKERIRIDLPTKIRLEECAKRKGFKVAQLIRMSYQYWYRVKPSDCMPSLTYITGRKSEIMEVTGLHVMIDENGDSDDCSAVVQFFLDEKDDGKTNGPAQCGNHNEDGTTSIEVAELGPVLEDAMKKCAIMRVDHYDDRRDQIYTMCSPSLPCVSIGKAIGTGTITCKNCIEVLKASRNFPLMQYTSLEVAK